MHEDMHEDLQPTPPPPPGGDARFHMLPHTTTEWHRATNEQLVKQNEAQTAMQGQILNLKERQAQPVVGTKVVVQSRESDPNSLYQKFRKRVAIEFKIEGPLQANEWIVHTENVYLTL
ncbi:hypothetical protein AAC387_Pa11g0460 [Persea americana]